MRIFFSIIPILLILIDKVYRNLAAEISVKGLVLVVIGAAVLIIAA